jgi:hypothetical protein
MVFTRDRCSIADLRGADNLGELRATWKSPLVARSTVAADRSRFARACGLVSHPSMRPARLRSLKLVLVNCSLDGRPISGPVVRDHPCG